MIEELEVTNFKAFSSATIRLGRYTLLSGLNSSGKSTVLQALALLRQGHADMHDFDASAWIHGRKSLICPHLNEKVPSDLG